MTAPTTPATAYAQPAYTNGYEFTQGAGYTLPEYPFVPPKALHTGEVEQHPIVIVGAGITGLTLACALARQGVAAVVLDEDNTVGVKGASSRGICYTQKSLEIFDRLGIYERIARKGVQWSVGRTFAGHDEVYAFDLRQQQNFNLSCQPPFINIQQFYIEGFLVERIAELGGVDLRWKSRVTGVDLGADQAVLQVDTPAGRYRLSARHVIDATGSHTPFHAWCGASLSTKRGDDRWCIADVRFADHPPVERHTWVEAPFNDNRAVWQHLMADDVWRIDYQMAPNADPAYVSREDVVRERLERQFGPQVACEIVWVGPYAYRSQCVDRLRMGPVFFIGDTAKVVSPFGARGGNTGIADADNLAWKLAAVHRDQAPAQLLDSYHAERHQAATENVQVTNRTARFLRPADGVERLFRNATLSLARQHPFARPLVNTGRMAVANRYSQTPVCSPDAGFSVQNVQLTTTEGQPLRLNDLLQAAQPCPLLLLVWGPQVPVQVLEHSLAGQAVAWVAVNQPPAASTLCAVQDTTGHLRQACALPDHGTACWALLRADAYLAAIGHDFGPHLTQALRRALGHTPETP